MFNIPELITTVGYLGIFGIVFAESGFLLGAFLPGDSLLFTAGLVASQGYLSIWLLTPLIMLAAILGDSFGYYCGRTFGPKIFNREDSFWFHKKHVERTRRFYDRHGKKTIILARFVPIVRTLAPIMAGVGAMEYRTFLSYNLLGGVAWGGGITLLGYFLGTVFPEAEKYLHFIIVAIILVSLIPVAWEVYRERQLNKKQTYVN